MTIRIENTSPFESLSLDKKSGQSTPSPDTFAAGFAALTQAIDSIAIPVPQLPAARPSEPPPTTVSYEDFRKQQSNLKKEMSRASTALSENLALRSSLEKLHQSMIEPNEVPDDPESWKHSVVTGLNAGLEVIADWQSIEAKVKSLDGKLANLVPSAAIDAPQLTDLKATQSQLDDASEKLASSASDLKDRLTQIKDVVTHFSGIIGPLECSIVNPVPLSHNVQTETWTLNTNVMLVDQLSPFSGDKSGRSIISFPVEPTESALQDQHSRRAGDLQAISVSRIFKRCLVPGATIPQLLCRDDRWRNWYGPEDKNVGRSSCCVDEY